MAWRSGVAGADRLAKADPENAVWKHNLSLSYITAVCAGKASSQQSQAETVRLTTEEVQFGHLRSGRHLEMSAIEVTLWRDMVLAFRHCLILLRILRSVNWRVPAGWCFRAWSWRLQLLLGDGARGLDVDNHAEAHQ